MDERHGRRWLGRYLAMFAVCALANIALFYLHGKLPIYNIDGYMQHYTVLGYLGKAVRALLAGRGWKLVDFSLGQGMDTLTTLGYHGYTDPLNLIAVLFPEHLLQYAYMLLAYLRALLAGICLVRYARRIGARDGWALSCAGIIYAFTGYAIYNLGWHIYFLNAMIWLPLLLTGVENCLREGRWLGYTLTAALMLLVNFYFAFLNTVTAIVYIVVRLLVRARRSGLRGTARDGFALLGGYLLGAALSAVVFLPVLLVFFGNVRMGESGGYAGSMLHYPPEYYAKLFLNGFTGWGLAPYWTLLAFVPLALAGVLGLLWKRTAASRQLLLAVLLCLAALSVPLVGKVLSGGSYLSNRWCYVLGTFVAAGCALSLPDLLRRRNVARRRIVGAALLLYAFALVAACALRRSFGRAHLAGIAMMALTGLVLLAYGRGKPAWLDLRRMRGAVCALVVLSVLVNMYTLYGVIDFYRKMTDWDIRTVYLGETAADLLESDGGPSRVEQPYYSDHHALLKGYLGTGFFWSMVPGHIGNYYRSLGLPSQMYLDMILDIGGGTAMESVAAVKRCLLPEDSETGVVPWGYEPAGSVETPTGARFEVYENPRALPLAYVYDRALPEAEYDALPVEQKLQALTAFAICDSDALPAARAGDASVELAFRAASSDGARLEADALHAREGGRLALDFESPADSEVWLLLEGLMPNNTAKFHVHTQWGNAYATSVGTANNYYYERPVTAVCLGGGEAATVGCELTFDTATDYRFDRMRLVALPLANYRRDLDARLSEPVTDIQLGVNRLSGRVSVGGERILQVAVPYSAGWRARVDGEERPVFRCGGMYMGLALAPGAHEIELRYVTPGLIPGAAISALALLATVVLAMRSAIRRRRRAAGTGDADGPDRAAVSGKSA